MKYQHNNDEIIQGIQAEISKIKDKLELKTADENVTIIRHEVDELNKLKKTLDSDMTNIKKQIVAINKQSNQIIEDIVRNESDLCSSEIHRKEDQDFILRKMNNQQDKLESFFKASYIWYLNSKIVIVLLYTMKYINLKASSISN